MIDLHTHTTFSDGSLTPTELIQLAKKTGLKAVAITDHDSIDGLIEAQAEADKLDVNFIKGIEFSVENNNFRLFHILGLGLDINNKDFLEIYNNYRETRAKKINYVFAELNKLGVKITQSEVEPFITGGLIDRQAIAKTIISKGLASDMKMAWNLYLDKIPYLKGELITQNDAFNAIHSAGGKAFMAHFHINIGLGGYSDDESRNILKKLKELGLDGLEYYYPSFTIEDSERCEKYIREFGFLKSGGSDFHGANRPHIKLGIGEGSFKVPNTILEWIL